MLLLEPPPAPELELDDAELDDAELDDAELDDAELDDAELDDAELELVPMPKHVPIDGEVAGASQEGFLSSATVTHRPTPSAPSVVSHLPVPQSVSAQQ